MHPDDIPKTAITTPFGTYTFNYSCFGLRNAGATFQRMIDTVLGDLPFCVTYVDYILVFSPKNIGTTCIWSLNASAPLVSSSAMTNASSGPERLTSWVITIITYKGVLPLQEKVAAVRAFPTPTTVKALQEFVGMVTYYHRFLPHIAATMDPL